MKQQDLIKKITEKKEFSNLPEIDVKLAFEKFDDEKYLDEEKVKLTRDLLRKVFSAFTSQKILKIKEKDSSWILQKHLSTRERLPYYEELYSKLLKSFKGKINLFDLGAGINGFSYPFFKKIGKEVNYIAVESMGQLVDLMNFYFKKEKFDSKAIHESLFSLDKIEKIIKNEKGQKIIFLFKSLDSLEMLQRDYSKQLLLKLVPLVDQVVVSFATQSLIKKTKFKVQRNWIFNFIKENFQLLDDFELGGERYISFKK